MIVDRPKLGNSGTMAVVNDSKCPPSTIRPTESICGGQSPAARPDDGNQVMASTQLLGSSRYLRQTPSDPLNRFAGGKAPQPDQMMVIRLWLRHSSSGSSRYLRQTPSDPLNRFAGGKAPQPDQMMALRRYGFDVAPQGLRGISARRLQTH